MLNPSIADFPYKSDDSFEEGVLLDLDYGYLRRLIEARHGEVSIEELAQYEAAARHEIHRQVIDGARISDSWRDYFRIILSKVGVPVVNRDGIVDSLWEAHQKTRPSGQETEAGRAAGEAQAEPAHGDNKRWQRLA